MITNLFSTFDPTTSRWFRINWIRIFLPFLILPSLLWLSPSRLNIRIYLCLNFIFKELLTLFKKINYNLIIIFISLFFMLLIYNIFGLLPYIFTPTRHLALSLNLSLPFWLGLIIYGWTHHTNHIFSHLIPRGTPILLSVFIVFIETTRNVIRPITLSVRLTANIIAGHLLLTLLREIPSKTPDFINFIFPLLCALILLETAVAVIQRYVFVTLSSLYTNEI